jgi:uncharacterized protein Veg
LNHIELYRLLSGVKTVQNSDLAQIKRDISRYVGRNVSLESNKGRSKSFIARGTIAGIYPGIFTVTPLAQDSGGRMLSFSYADVLTRAVEITVFE